jgi:DNA-binding response OmpR family regulator
MRVLLVEDSRRLRQAVGTGLRRAGYAVDVAGDGDEGLWYAESNDYDVIVLDLMLPGTDGLTVLERLREGGKSTHVLILTAKDTVEDRVHGLQAGADDYLVKPFAFEELLARVQALARRAHGVKTSQIVLGDLVVDLAARTVRRADRLIDLRPREYALLELLALRRGEVVSRSEIEHHIYDDRAEPMSNVVDAAVYALRKKIDVPGRLSLIQTRRGMGYLIEEGNA